MHSATKTRLRVLADLLPENWTIWSLNFPIILPSRRRRIPRRDQSSQMPKSAFSTDQSSISYFEIQAILMWIFSVLILLLIWVLRDLQCLKPVSPIHELGQFLVA